MSSAPLVEGAQVFHSGMFDFLRRFIKNANKVYSRPEFIEQDLFVFDGL